MQPVVTNLQGGSHSYNGHHLVWVEDDDLGSGGILPHLIDNLTSPTQHTPDLRFQEQQASLDEGVRVLLALNHVLKHRDNRSACNTQVP